LRSDIQKRVESLAVNPLEAAPQREMQVALARYTRLQAEADPDGPLAQRIDKERRAELADFGESRKARVVETLLHDATFGIYTHRVGKNDIDLAGLDRDRRIQYQLNFLDSLVQAGTRPEIAYESSRITASVDELSRLMPEVRARAVRAHAAATIEQLGTLSRDTGLKDECSQALASLERNTAPVRATLASGAVAASRRAVPVPPSSVVAAVK
jgi:hypothetical protein